MISLLYVDDEPDLLELTRIFLEQSGEFRVLTSTSAEGMLDNPETFSCDAIISDYQMAGMDGIAFLKEIRKRSTDLPFLLFTGRGREEVVIDALNNGADFYIQKGGDPQAQFAELANKIRYAVNRRQTEKELQKKSDELNASYEQIAASEEELRQQLDELTVKQEALRISEEKFRAFTENIPDLTTISDINGNYRYISPSIRRITGQSADMLAGKKYAGVSSLFGIVEADTGIILASGKTAIDNPGTPVPVPPFRVRDFKGEVIFIEGTITYLPDIKGIQGLLFHGRDITDRVRAEKEIAQKAGQLSGSYEQLAVAEEELRGQYEELALGQKQIRESEEMFRTLVEMSPLAVIVQQEGKVVYMNPEACRLAKAEKPADLIGQDVLSFIHPDDHEKAIEHFNLLDQEKPIPITEERLVALDGVPFVVEIAAKKIRYEGHPAVLVAFHDITDRKRAEEALFSSQQMLQTVLDTIPQRVFWKDKNSVFRGCNKALANDAGLSDPSEIIGKTDYDDTFRETADLYRTDDLAVMETGRPRLNFEEPQVRPDGSQAWLSTSKVPMRDKNGNVIGVLGTYEDITERKLMEQALRLSEEKYRRILESMEDTYIRSDRDGQITMVNPAAVRMFGYGTADELIGLPTESLYLDPGRRRDLLKRLHEGEKVSDITEVMRHRDGTSFWVSISIQFTRAEDGTITGTEGIVRDISERKTMEQALQDTNKKLNLLNSITRHDVANQLTVLQGYVQLAGARDPDPVMHDFLKKIELATDTISRQIEFTKNYQDLGVRTPSWFRLEDIFESTARPGISFSKTCLATEIYADPMIERVFFNLFDNAFQHGEHVTVISNRCERAPDGLVIIVEDDGVGIAPEEKEKIFGKAYGQNTGFGLFLAREILAITGITIRETGYLGIGARFEITVPKDKWRITPAE